MLEHIVFRSKPLRRLRLNIKPEIDFGIVLGILDEINTFPDSRFMPHIRFSLLELINNSLRAHRNHGVEEPMKLEFSMVQDFEGQRGLRIILEDSGRGFDPGDLPYNIYGPVEKVDLQSEAFQIYREMHKQQRFGMGLHVTRKTFDRFSLEFISHDNRIITFQPGEVRGTRIRLIHWGRKDEQ